MAETICNDWTGTLATPLLSTAGAGATFDVTPLTPALDVAGYQGAELRARVGDEVVRVTITNPNSWTVVEREAEDATRYPKQSWPVGTSVDIVVTREGLEAFIATHPADLPDNVAFTDADQTFTGLNAFTGSVFAVSGATVFSGPTFEVTIAAATFRSFVFAHGGLRAAGPHGTPEAGEFLHLRHDGTDALISTTTTTGITFRNSLNTLTTLHIGDDGTITAPFFVGDGSGMTNIPAGALPSNVAYFDQNQTWTSTQVFGSVAITGANIAGALITTSFETQAPGVYRGTPVFPAIRVLNNAVGTAALQEWQSDLGVVLASIDHDGVFTGSGAGVTDLNASNLASGTVPQARLGPGYYDYSEVTPANPDADVVRAYAVDFNGYSFPEYRDSAGRVMRPTRDQIAVAKVDEVSGIQKGQAVYISGATGTTRQIKLARADSRATTPGLGLAMETGANNAFIRVMTFGLLTGLDTSAWTEGLRVFLSATTAGALTTTVPQAPNLAQRVGFVLRTHATQGEIGVFPSTAVSEAAWVGTHADMHAPGGRDEITNLSATALTSGSVPDARITTVDLLRPLANAEIAVTGATTATLGRMHVCSGTTASYSLTLPAVTGNAGKWVGVRMSPALTKHVVLDSGAGVLIYGDGPTGQQQRLMQVGESAYLYCDGTNWHKKFGKTIPFVCRLRLSASQAITNATITPINLDTVDLDSSGGVMSSVANKITIVRAGRYRIITGVRFENLSATGTRMSGFASLNGDHTGTQLAFSEFHAESGSYPFTVGVEVVSLAYLDYLMLCAFQNSGSSQNAYGHATNQSASLTVEEIPAW